GRPRRFSRSAIAAGDRAGQRKEGVGASRRARVRPRRAFWFRTPGCGGSVLAGLLPHAAASTRCRDRLGWAGWPDTSVVSAASRAALRLRTLTRRRPRPARTDRYGLPKPRTLSLRSDARPARRDRRRRRPPRTRRGLSDPVDDPFCQGAGMGRGLPAEPRRWLHPLGYGHRQAG